MSDIPVRVLPPPAETLLTYAAYGWSANQDNTNPSGRPRLPHPEDWLPVFAKLLAAPNGMELLERFTVMGMHSWGVDRSIIKVVPAAFAWHGLRDKLAALYPGPSPVLSSALMTPALPTASPAPAPVADLTPPPVIEAVSPAIAKPPVLLPRPRQTRARLPQP